MSVKVPPRSIQNSQGDVIAEFSPLAALPVNRCGESSGRSPAASLANLLEALLPAAEPDGRKLIARPFRRHGQRAPRIQEVEQPGFEPLPAAAIELAILSREAEI